MKHYVWTLGLLLFAHGCAKTEPMSAFGRCGQDADCGTGLFCAQGGPLAGYCARSCSEHTDCSSRYGASHACVESVCVQVCGELSECSAPELTQFERCAAGLSCRALDSEACTGHCTASSWGTPRAPGVSSGVDSGGGLAGGSPSGAASDGGSGGGTTGGGASDDGGSTLDGAVDQGDAASMDGSADGEPPGSDSGMGASYACPGLPAITDYTAPGPFDVAMFPDVGPNDNYTMFRPDTALGQGGFKHPIAAWGNAGYENGGPEDYSIFLGFVASHGFVVIASNDQLVDRAGLEAGMDWLVEQNVTGPLAGKLDVTREVMFGHFWGGDKAIEAAHRENVRTVISLHGPQPNAAMAESMHAPLLLLTSKRDEQLLDGMSPIYGNAEVVPIFAAIFDDESLTTSSLLDEHEACFGVLPCPRFGGEVQRVPVIAWLRLWVCEDSAARQFFYGDDCVLCGSPWAPPLRTPAMLGP